MPAPVLNAGSPPIPWLLSGDDPSVRFFTLTDLLGSSPDAPDGRRRRGARS